MNISAYPILCKLSFKEAEAYVRQAEAGIPLTCEQLARLGLHPGFKNFILLPQDGAATNEQLRAAFRGWKVLT